MVCRGDDQEPSSATENLVVVLRSVDGTESHTIELKKHEFARAVAFDAKSQRLAVTIGHKLADTDFPMEGAGSHRFLRPENPHGDRRPARPVSRLVHGVSPRWQGCRHRCRGEYQVTLWNIGHWDHPVSVMAGAGRSLWGVAVSADGNEIAFRNPRNPQSLDPNDRGKDRRRIFNLLKRKWTDPADFKPVKQLSAWKGWTVKPNKGDAYVWYAVTPNNDHLPLPLDKRRDGMPLCYTFLPPKRQAAIATGGLVIYGA